MNTTSRANLLRSSKPGEFQGPTGCAWSTPPTSHTMTGTKDVTNVGFEVSKVDDGLDYGSDDDWDPEKEHPLANFKNDNDKSKNGDEWWKEEEEKVRRTFPLHRWQGVPTD